MTSCWGPPSWAAFAAHLNPTTIGICTSAALFIFYHAFSALLATRYTPFRPPPLLVLAGLSRPSAPPAHPHHFLYCSVNIVSASVVAGCAAAAIAAGQSAVLPSLGAGLGWWSGVRDTASLVLVHTGEVYAWHRLMHTKACYAAFHKVHHAVLSPLPFDDLLIHPLEAFLYYLLLWSPMWIVRCGPASVVAYMSVMGLTGVLDHAGLGVRVPFLYDSDDHAVHHEQFVVNYSFPHPVIDWVAGTYRAPKRKGE